MNETDTPVSTRSLHDQARALLEADLVAIPAGHTSALVAVADARGMRAGVAVRVGDTWALSGEVEKRWQQRPEGRLTVRASWLLWLVLLVPALAWAQPASYPATLERVIDGDTYVLRVELGFDVITRATIRLADLDTPERFTEAGRRAAAAADALLRVGPITVAPTGARSFTRWVAHVHVAGESLADALRAGGYEKRE